MIASTTAAASMATAAAEPRAAAAGPLTAGTVAHMSLAVAIQGFPSVSAGAASRGPPRAASQRAASGLRRAIDSGALRAPPRRVRDARARDQLPLLMALLLLPTGMLTTAP
jgi:hypothetical protein